MKNSPDLISAEKAYDLVLDEIQLAPTHKLPLRDCLGMVLREEILAERCGPPFDRVMMDGVALKKKDLDAGQRTFGLEGMAQAGHPQILLKEQTASEVCTGAILPLNADQVVPYEMLSISDKTVTIHELPPEPYIHKKGSDFSQHDGLLKSGLLLNAPRLGACAGQGKSQLLVSLMPKLSIVSTGDELVSPEKESLEDYQIRLSNPYAFAAELESWGFKNNQMTHLPDDKDEILKRLGKLLEQNKFIIFSGAISKGAFDFLPQAFEHYKIQTIFHGVKQKPGKPLFFGKGPQGQIIFALPGNPISSLINLRRYVIPALLKHIGLKTRDHFLVQLSEPIKGKEGFTSFVPSRLEEKEGRLIAHTLRMNNSGDYHSLTHSHGFLLINSANTEKPQVFIPWGGRFSYGPEF